MPIPHVRVPVVLAGLALLVGAGCLFSPAEDGGGPRDTTEEPEGEQGDIETTSEPSTQTEASPLQRPPSWLPGEYWTVRVDSTLLEEPVEWTRVVAGYTSDTYLVGQPADNASLAGLLLHVPGLGEVSQANLSYGIHGSTFTPLQFPLEDGRTWQTTFEGRPVNASAQLLDSGEVRLHYCCSRNVTATYDPDVRALTEMTVADGLITYEVLDHGFAFDDPVEVPRDRDLAFLQGRVAGALAARGGPGAPVGQAEVPEEFDRLAFTQIVGNADVSPAPETGVYVERAQHPNGTSYVTEQAASTEGLQISFHEATDASGTWRFQHIAGGPGVAFTEGIAYNLERHEMN